MSKLKVVAQPRTAYKVGERRRWQMQTCTVAAGKDGRFAERASTMSQEQSPVGGSGGTVTITRPKTSPPRVKQLPPWKVLLHNDDVNEAGYVVEAIIELTTLEPQAALLRMLEAHRTGVALLLTTHREHAELLSEQFASKRLTVTIEPED
ncbi:MAG: ATP-dependent Clp protease adaptor ClpS [Phycisphaerales bacterium]|nr:MAG: ATP-dependent Clp protease adaptor ClpS [Phycisphaerales bacterium]